MAKKFNLDLDRLCSAMQKDRQSLRRYREERREAVRQFVGNHWSELGTSEKVPVNLLSLYISVVGRSLVSKNPRVMISTDDSAQKPAVAMMEAWANDELERMDLMNTLQRAVLDSLFSIGVVKVAIADPSQSAARGFLDKAGEPFAERIDLDDFVFDVHARDFSEVSYIGHRYRVPLEVARESKFFSAARKDLSASADSPYNLEGDERVSLLGRGLYTANSEEFEDYVDLWEVYLPRHRRVLTLRDDDLAGATGGGTGGVSQALREQAWIGAEEGPYQMFALGLVPGNAMPKAPIQDLIDLHLLVNNLYRKLSRQAERQKEVLAVAGGANEDGTRIMTANDGEIIRVDNPERSVPRSFGAPNEHNFRFALHTKDLFSLLGGNLDILGGLSPQSKTAHQDAMLNENSSKLLQDMQARVIGGTAGVIRRLCWLWHHHPSKVMRATHAAPGLPEFSINRQLTPEMRQRGRFEDMNIKIDPYSMQYQTPQQRLQALNMVVQQVVMPMMPLLQQQGIRFDLNTYLKKVAKYADMPDLPEILTIGEPSLQEQGAQAEAAPTMPAQTTRTYERRSLGSESRPAKDAAIVNSLGGGGSDKNAQTNGVLAK